MDMIEKVAKAICMAQWGGYPLDEQKRSEWPEWRQAVKTARAAIEAMREPTDGMLSAGSAEWVEDYRQRTETLLAAWEAAIDAALKGE